MLARQLDAQLTLHVEHLLDELHEVAARLEDLLHALVLALPERLQLEQLREPGDGRSAGCAARGHPREELALGAVGALGIRPGGPDRIAGRSALAGQDATEGLRCLAGALGGFEHGDGPADRLARRVPLQPLGRRVPARDGPVGRLGE